MEEGWDNGGGQMEATQHKLHSLVELITECNDLKGLLTLRAQFLALSI